MIAIGYRGESQAFKEAGGSIWLVFVLTILIVYLLLAAQFESFVHPAVIITTVPLAVGGGVIGLAVMGQTLNLYSQVGLVMLVGLAAKNGILIVEFANQLRDQGRDIGEAIREASARRLRPILMTSIATVAGAVPLMIAERRRRRRAHRDRRGHRLGRLDLDPDHPVPDPAPLFAPGPLHRLAAGGDPQARGAAGARPAWRQPAAGGMKGVGQMTGIASRAQLRMSLPALRLFTVPLVLLLGTLSGRISGSGYGNPWFDALDQAGASCRPAGCSASPGRSSTSCSASPLAMILHARGARGRGLAVDLVRRPARCSTSPGRRSSSPITRSAPPSG